jgi:hypothetical protein
MKKIILVAIIGVLLSVSIVGAKPFINNALKNLDGYITLLNYLLPAYGGDGLFDVLNATEINVDTLNAVNTTTTNITGDLDVDGYVNASSDIISGRDLTVTRATYVHGNIIPPTAGTPTISVGIGLNNRFDTVYATNLRSTFWRALSTGDALLGFSSQGIWVLDNIFGVPDNSFDLGVENLRWKNVYVANNISDGNRNITISDILTNQTDINVASGTVCDQNGCIGDATASQATEGTTQFRFRNNRFEIRVS